MPLNDEQLKRYSRQLVMPEFPEQVQERLLSSHVLVHGTGFSVDLCVLYLAAAGVGHLHLSSRGTELEKLAERASSLNRGAAVTFGARGLLPDMVLDFSQDVGPSGARRVAGALESGFPFVMALRANDAALIRQFSVGDPCPGCILNAAGIGVTELLASVDNGLAGPATAAVALGRLAGHLKPSGKTLILALSATRFEEIESTPVEGCVLCGILSGGKTTVSDTV